MLILIGQAPNCHNDERHALEGRIGARLCRLFGCQEEDYLKWTQRFNVLPRWPGKTGKGDKFPLALARQNARRMRYSLAGCHVMFVGVATAKVFGVTHIPFRWVKVEIAEHNVGSFSAAVVPHPSGVNMWWNLECNKNKARRFMCRAWINHARR